jgi:hypothetical protein
MSMTMSVSGADRSLKFDWKAASSAWAADVEPVASRAMKMAAPFRTGAMRQGIGSRLEPSAGSMWVVLYSTASYAGYVIGGTKPHVITATNAKALRWFANAGHGPVMFAKSVNHPGTKPNNFPERAISPLKTLILQSFADAAREATIIE